MERWDAGIKELVQYQVVFGDMDLKMAQAR